VISGHLRTNEAGRLLRVALLAVLLAVGGTAADAQTPAPSPPAVEAPAEPAAPPTDATIAGRIGATLGNYDTFEQVQVSVQGGVARLSGEVPSPGERERAATLAGRIDGVLDVRNDLRVSEDVARQAGRAWHRIAARAEDYLVYMPVLALALAVFVLFWFVARWLSAREALYRRVSPNRFVRQLVAQVVRSVVVIVGLVFALEILEATALIGAVMGAAGVTGLVVGFALKEMVENYVAGVLLSLRQPFSPHDLVQIDGREGHVVRLTSRATILLTPEGNHVRLPNALVFKGVIVNFTRNPERRFDFTLGLATDTDLAAAQALAIETVGAVEGVLQNPAPDAWISAVGDSSLSLYIIAWVDQRRHAFPKVRSEAIRQVLARFGAAGIETPEPIYRVNLTSALATAGDAARPPARPPKPAPKPAGTAAAAGVDLTPDTHLDAEIARERSQTDSEDLLDPAAKKE
jgi:small-conductance mechanosensitive channel